MGNEVEILNELSNNQNIVWVCDTDNYSKLIDNLFKEAEKKFNSIGVIESNKPVETIFNKSKNLLHRGKFLFIDCITGKSKNARDTAQLIYASGPSGLTELSIILSELIKKVDLLIFDNLSTLLIYNNDIILTKFLHSTITKMRATNTKAVYIILKKDFKGPLKDLELFADKVVEDK